jgi:uncharacterized protein (UPF0332 family)
MRLNDEERAAIVSLRLERAKETMTEAKANADLGYWRVTANRLYYACFYAATALLIKHGHSAQTHSGVIVMLGLHFVKQGIISKEQGLLYQKLFEQRQTGDYGDMVVIDPDTVKASIEPAEAFIATVRKLIEEQ